jgi:hypothetical protein
VLALLNDDEQWHLLARAGLAYARDITSRASANERIRALVPAPPARKAVQRP